MMSEECTNAIHSLWIFGYGSLTWKPNMVFNRREIGYILGYKRRFWQGSTTHRGTTQKPGRVATMIQDDLSVVWGAAFEITGAECIKKTMRDLNNRESILGGYKTFYLPFHLRSLPSDTIDVVVYAATQDNEMYQGSCDLSLMAKQIVSTSGHAGPNHEYITKLADFTRLHIPQDADAHLFDLDKKIRQLLRGRTPSICRQESLVIVNDNDIVDELVKAGVVKQTDPLVPTLPLVF